MDSKVPVGFNAGLPERKDPHKLTPMSSITEVSLNSMDGKYIGRDDL